MEKRRGMPGPREEDRREIFEKIVFLASGESGQVSIAEFGVWIPKYRRKVLYGRLRRELVDVFHDLARQKDSRILEGHLQPCHIHMLISIPPKYSVAQVVGFMKGKSAIHIARVYLGQRKNYNGMHFWARGYYVSTVGADEEVIRNYIRNQEKEDQKLEALTGM